MNYQEEMDYIVQSDKRNKFIRKLGRWSTMVTHFVYFSMLRNMVNNCMKI